MQVSLSARFNLLPIALVAILPTLARESAGIAMVTPSACGARWAYMPRPGRPAAQRARTGCGNFGGASVGLFIAVACFGPLLRRAGSRMSPHARLKAVLRKKAGSANVSRLRERHLKSIVVAIKVGGGSPDPKVNSRLDRAIKTALKDSVPRSAIDGRIKAFASGGEDVFQLTIQGYCPGGAAIMVECVGGNESAMREFVTKVFTKCGGNVGRDSCVECLFQRRGLLRFSGIGEDELLEASMGADIEDYRLGDDGLAEVVTLPEKFHASIGAFERAGIEPSTAQMETMPMVENELGGKDAYETLRLIVLLEELDCVQTVHTNAVIPEGLELVHDFYGKPLSWDWVQKNT
mmetsp:Transcript_105537/g.296994  ORF Transcript_105537/g.296994 Transcript_105537/m.296994 type:complete len:349 (+) Transcript_105537:98-1144(+)